LRVRTEAKREAILGSAAEVFMEMGYERASMAEIAERSVCSKPTLYSYFPSKAELFMGAIMHKIGGTLVSHIQAALMELPTLAAEDPGPVLMRFGEHFIAAVDSPEAYAFKRLIAATMTDRVDAERFWELGNEQLVKTIEAYLSAATEAGRLKVRNARVAAQQLLALYEAEITWSGPIGFPPELPSETIPELAARAVQVFLAAYGLECELGREK